MQTIDSEGARSAVERVLGDGGGVAVANKVSCSRDSNNGSSSSRNNGSSISSRCSGRSIVLVLAIMLVAVVLM